MSNLTLSLVDVRQERLGCDNMNLKDYGYTTIQIETKGICNMRCEFCIFPSMTDRGSTLDSSLIFSLLSELDEGTIISLFRYNEPLLDERIFDFVDYANTHGLSTEVRTNGLLLTNGNIRKKIIAHMPNEFSISMLQTNKIDFALSRGTKVSFDSYLEGIQQYITESGTQPTIYVGCNFRKWYSPLKRLLGIEVNIPTISNIPEESYSGKFGVSISLKPFINAYKLTEFYPTSCLNPCMMDTLAVDSNGVVSPCCMTYGNMFPLGNLKDNTLGEILEQSKDTIANIRSGKNLPECCYRCQGQPTNRGAKFVSWYRELKKVLPLDRL